MQLVNRLIPILPMAWADQVGSTLRVAPANELPAEALRRGTPVILVNFDETRDLAETVGSYHS